MKILFYLLAFIAGTFGLISLVGAVESSLTGGFNPIQFVIGIVGIFLATLWVMRVRALK